MNGQMQIVNRKPKSPPPLPRAFSSLRKRLPCLLNSQVLNSQVWPGRGALKKVWLARRLLPSQRVPEKTQAFPKRGASAKVQEAPSGAASIRRWEHRWRRAGNRAVGALI